MTLPPALAMIRDRIRLLAAIDPDRQIFGASMHRHELAPVYSADDVAALEAQLGPFPDDYRRFIERIGAHGAGPYYGLLEPAAPDDPTTLLQPDPMRVFRLDGESPHNVNLPSGANLLDGTLVLAEQGCGGRSLLVLRGSRAGEVWSDWTRDHGTIAPEARNFAAWYEQWIDRALLDWVERSAAHIAMDGPSAAAELEAIAHAFELVVRAATDHAVYSRTLGYLHLREERWQDAEAAFVAASQAGTEEPAARLALDRARLAVKRGTADDAISVVQRGLAIADIWYSTRDELRETLERAYAAIGRPDDALRVLEDRVAERHFSLDLHHRLARERLARNDLANAGAVLERAALFASVLGRPQPLEVRVPASFDPIIEELRKAGRNVDADALAARRSLILDAN